MAIALHLYRRPVSFDWDFSQRHELSMIPWPADNHTDVCWWGRREIKIRIRIDADRRYVNDDAWDVYVKRDGGHLRGIDIMEQPTTANEARRRAEELLKAWGTEPDGLKSWADGAVGDSLEGYLMNVRSTDRTRWPAISVEIHRSPATPDRPWFVHVQLYWFNDDIAPHAPTRRGSVSR